MIFCEYASPIPERLVNSAFDALLMSSSAVFVARAAFAADVDFFGAVCAPLDGTHKRTASTRTNGISNSRERFMSVLLLNVLIRFTADNLSTSKLQMGP